MCVDCDVRLVSEAMGGAVEVERLHELPWVLHLSELKFQLQSNVIPIGLIRQGIYCHRALLFKVPLTSNTWPALVLCKHLRHVSLLSVWPTALE